MKSIISFLLVLLLIFSCQKPENENYLGGRATEALAVDADTVFVDASIISGQGQFFLEENKLLFADHLYASMYYFDLNGKFQDRKIGLGDGPKELPRLLSLFPVNNDEYLAFVDTNVGFFVKPDMDQKKRFDIDFGWKDPARVAKNKKKSDPTDVFIYEPFHPNEFIANVEMVGDHHIMFQVDATRRDFNPYSRAGNADDFYEEAHTFGLINLETGEFEKVFGNYSKEYQKHSFLPNYRGFSYDKSGDTLFVSYPIDSLIYAYKYPDELLYTFGAHGEDMRDVYTATLSREEAEARLDTDLLETGNYFYLKYIPETNVLFRSYIKGKGNDHHGLQVYKGAQLVADIEVDPFFQVLGIYEGYYYATNFLIDEENQRFKIYKFKL